MSPKIVIREIVSGGQTGVDRGALDAALAAGISCGGWCPSGRRAEDGRIPDRYTLRETDGPDHADRTRRNVADSDGTLILVPGAEADRASDGTRLTARIARGSGKPLLVLDPTVAQPEAVIAWAARHGIARLNVAGPRESGAPGIAAAARRFIAAVIAAREGVGAAQLPESRSAPDG